MQAIVFVSLLAAVASSSPQAPPTDEPLPEAGSGGTVSVPPHPIASDPYAEDFELTIKEKDGALANLEYGDTLLSVGKLPEAARAFQWAVAAKPDLLRAWEGLRRVYVAAERPDRLPPVLVRLVDLYLAIGDPDARSRANQRLDELIAVSPKHPERARLEAALGRGAQAKKGETTWLMRLRSFLGLLVVIGIAFLLSNNRRAVRLRTIGWGLGLQLIFAFFLLWKPKGVDWTPGALVFNGARVVITRILGFTDAGASFLFGKLYDGLAPSPGHGPMQLVDAASGDPIAIGLIFVMHVLPTIIFFGALMSVLYHYGIIQKVVRGIAWVMSRTMRTSGSESLSAAANIFVGQTEAPLVVKPYINTMTQSEVMAIMVGGFATVAGGVLAAYVRFGIDAGHLLAASVMGAPAALALSKIMVPETEPSETAGGKVHNPPRETSNVIDAAATGAADGMRLAINVAAMLMAFISLVALINGGLGWLGGLFHVPALSLKMIFGYMFYPLSWCLGVPTQDLLEFGNLIGTKISLNEFVAYVALGAEKGQLSARTVTIATYALCGFANFSSIGIQIGGISAIAPGRRADLAKLGLRAMVAGAMASLMTASIAGMLL